MELNISLRHQAFKVPRCNSYIIDQHLRNALDHEFGRSNENEEDNEIRVGMMFDYNENEYEIIRVFDNKVVAKAIVDGIEIEITDLEFVLNACNEKLE